MPSREARLILHPAPVRPLSAAVQASAARSSWPTDGDGRTPKFEAARGTDALPAITTALAQAGRLRPADAAEAAALVHALGVGAALHPALRPPVVSCNSREAWRARAWSPEALREHAEIQRLEDQGRFGEVAERMHRGLVEDARRARREAEAGKRQAAYFAAKRPARGEPAPARDAPATPPRSTHA